MSETTLSADLTHFLAGWLAARGQGNLLGFIIALETDDFTQSAYPDGQGAALSLGLASFATESVRDDLKREFDALAE